MNKEYDLAVVYRIYPGVSKVPIIYENNKFELSKIAIKTFAEALGDMKVKVWIILDNCSEEYDKLFITALKKFDIELIKLNGEGVIQHLINK